MTELPNNSPNPSGNTADTIPSQDPVLSGLVGEGKKFKTVEDLAKGKLEADNFIAQLQNEQAELRAELEKRITLEKLMDSILSTQPKPVVPTTESEPAQPSPASQETPAKSGAVPTDVEMENKVKAIIQAREEQARTEANRASVEKALLDKFGSVEEAKKIVAEKASALGVSVDFFQSVGDKAPNALLSMLGVVGSSVKPSAGSSPSSINPVAVSSAVGTTSGDEQELKSLHELRRTKPNEYFLPRNQQRMMELNMRIRKAKA